jgi:hypothetical protein
MAVEPICRVRDAERGLPEARGPDETVIRVRYTFLLYAGLAYVCRKRLDGFSPSKRGSQGDTASAAVVRAQ